MLNYEMDDLLHRYSSLPDEIRRAIAGIRFFVGCLYTGDMRVAVLGICLAVPLLAASVAGLQWTAPPEWKDAGSAPMRAVTYKVPLAAGDRGASECVVYFFGRGEGGPVQANIERWNGQLLTPSGKTAPAQIKKRGIHGLPVTTIDVSGTYTGMAGPTAQSAPVPGYRLLGAVVENPGGNIFVKFAGPARTVTANAAIFEKLLASFEPKRQ